MRRRSSEFLLSVRSRRFLASLRRWSPLSRLTQLFFFSFRRNQKRNRMGDGRIIYQHLVLAGVLTASCGYSRPIHPMRLDGFPGAPIEAGLYPLADGIEWVYEDEVAGKGVLRLRMRSSGERYLLSGVKEVEVEVRIVEGFLEIVADGVVGERPLKLVGKVGDRWKLGRKRYTVFGYDELEILGEKRRALVVAVDLNKQIVRTTPEGGTVRDLFWYAKGVGLVRMRTEFEGLVMRDARLTELTRNGERVTRIDSP